MEGCDRWRRPHPEQPLGGPDGWHLAVGMPHTRQQCTAAVASSRPREHAEGPPRCMVRCGGVLHQKMIKK